jgi:long-chain acyl-CoA synthetase
MKIHTLADLVFQVIPRFNKPDCLMVKKNGVYISISAAEVRETVESVAAKLIDAGVQKGDRVGLLSENRPEWAYADLAIICAGGITVPIYSTLPSKQVDYILRDAGIEILFVSTQAQYKKILEVKDELPQLRLVIVFDSLENLSAGSVTFSVIHEEGAQILKANPGSVRERLANIQEDDVFTIIYTSGTTGEPKGVMLTHKNLTSNIEASHKIFSFNPQDRALSFLPLSHIFERMAGYYLMLYAGATIAYAENIESLPKNFMEVRPTLLISVPRIYEKFYARVTDNLAAEHGVKKKLAQWGLRIASDYAARKIQKQKIPFNLRMKYAAANRLVLSKIRAKLGGRLRMMVSGGAALPRHLGPFFYGLGLQILEGYGLTETSPVISVNLPDNFKFGTVGKPLSNVEVKIAEDGEILTRGPHVMKSYYQKPKETAEVLSPDGWFRTGDIGEIDQDGFLKITDRKKDLIVTSGGKKIAPQFVENSLKTSRYVVQIVVLGNKRNYPCALVVPNLENLKKYAAEKQVPESELFKSPILLAEIERDLNDLSKDLAPFERVKRIALVQKEFSIESGDLTPSLKIKRNVVEQKYKDVIDQLYTEPALT